MVFNPCLLYVFSKNYPKCTGNIGPCRPLPAATERPGARSTPRPGLQDTAVVEGLCPYQAPLQCLPEATQLVEVGTLRRVVTPELGTGRAYQERCRAG